MKGKSRKKKIIAGVSAIALLLLAAALYMKFNGGETKEMAEITASKQDIVTFYSFTGNIKAHETQYVLAISNEPVKKFYVKEGQRVEQGDVLYEVDSNNIQSTLTQARTSLANANNEYNSALADYDLASLNYDRIKSLFDIGGVSQQELESAQKSLSSAKKLITSAQNQITQATANMQQAQNQYQDTMRLAEIAGEVSKIYVKENQSLNMGASIMDIIDYDNLEVEIKVDEYDLSAITEGKEAEIQVEALGKRLIGTVSEIAREASVENGVSYFKATVVLPSDRDLRIGLTAEIRIITQRALGVTAVPVAAVSYDFNGAYVQVHGPDGKIANKPVIVGINNGRMIEIKEGVADGETVLFDASAAAGGPQMQMMPGANFRVGPGGPGSGGGGGGGGGRQSGGVPPV